MVAVLVLGPWALWHLADPSPEQVRVITAPLVRVPLHTEPVKQRFIVPNDLAWRRVRFQWGEPHFYVLALTTDRGGPRLCSQDEAPVAATVNMGSAFTVTVFGAQSLLLSSSSVINP